MWPVRRRFGANGVAVSAILGAALLVAAGPVWGQAAVQAATPAAATPAPIPTLTPDQAREDVQLAIDALEAALPNLYWHQSQADWARAKTAALSQVQSLSDPMQIYAVLSRMTDGIGEGHLAVQLPPAVIKRQRETASGLPLDLHWSTEGVFVMAAYGEAADIPAGTRLLSINGQDQATLLADLSSMTSHDGHILTGVMREAAADRYAVLRNRFHGDEAVFTLRYQRADGAVAERSVAAVPLAARPKRTPADNKRVATLEWVAPGVAYLNVPTFSNRTYRAANTTFRAQMQALFEDIRRGRATRLILDLRENGGGSEPNESILFSYLVAEPLHKYAAVEARGHELSVTSLSGKRFDTKVYDDDEMNFQQRLPDGRLTRLNVPPEGLTSHWAASSPVFTGQLVILAGGETFSGGAELSSMLYHVKRGVFVGEEVGGTHEGNTSGYAWELTLPNSGVGLHIPVLQFRFNWTGLPAHRGVPAGCEAPPLVGEIGQQRDRAWRVARQVVMQDWASPDQVACPALEPGGLTVATGL